MENIILIFIAAFIKFFPIGALMTIGSYWIVRRRGGISRLVAARETILPERILSWTGKWLTILVILELYLTKKDRFTAMDAYWLNVLPLLWLTLSIRRKDLPADRTANIVGIWTLMPYAAFSLSNKDVPHSAWLSIVAFGVAFSVGIWRDVKRPL